LMQGVESPDPQTNTAQVIKRYARISPGHLRKHLKQIAIVINYIPNESS